jgi:hypothetical protein
MADTVSVNGISQELRYGRRVLARPAIIAHFSGVGVLFIDRREGRCPSPNVLTTLSKDRVLLITKPHMENYKCPPLLAPILKAQTPCTMKALLYSRCQWRCHAV